MKTTIKFYNNQKEISSKDAKNLYKKGIISLVNVQGKFNTNIWTASIEVMFVTKAV